MTLIIPDLALSALAEQIEIAARQCTDEAGVPVPLPSLAQSLDAYGERMRGIALMALRARVLDAVRPESQ